MKHLYRYETEYSSIDGDTSIYLKKFPVIRETEKCYYIRKVAWDSKESKVLKNAHNTYAYDDEKKAKDHFIRRLSKRISWYEYWIDECKKSLDLINEGKSDK